MKREKKISSNKKLFLIVVFHNRFALRNLIYISLNNSVCSFSSYSILFLPLLHVSIYLFYNMSNHLFTGIGPDGDESVYPLLNQPFVNDFMTLFFTW